MDLSISDWMVVIFVLLMLVVGLDGYRRSKRERENRVRISKAAKRRAKQRGPQQDPNYVERTEGEIEAARLRNSDLGIIKKEVIVPAEVNSGLDERDKHEEYVESEATTTHDTYAVDPLFENPFDVDEQRLRTTAVVESAVDESEMVEGEQAVSESAETLESDEEPQELEGEFQHNLMFGREQEEARVVPDEILVLHVVATDAEGFSGEDLLHILRACDCRIGEMNIFHRYEAEGAKGAVQFSIVNMVEPGTFNLDDISTFSTPGVSFFLRLPGPEDPAEAHKCMVEVAQCLVRNLGAELKDDMLSTVTEQTLSHDRQRIRDYQQRQLLAE